MRAILVIAAVSAMMATSANAQLFKPKPKPAAGATPSTAVMTSKTAMMSKTSSTAVTHNGKPRTAASIDCSKQADAKGLHGNDRKKFRSSCIKAAK
jgi:hypothetical protein